MGGCSIEMELPGDTTKSQVISAFKAQKEQDRDYNDHQEGYSGDFQTVNEVKFPDKTFYDYGEAHDYCMAHAEKWCFVVAVKVVQDKETKVSNNSTDFIANNKSKKLLTLEKRYKDETATKETLRTKITKGIKEAKSKTIGCKKCESNINRKYIKEVLWCPVCYFSLISPTGQKQLQNKKDKVEEIKKKLEEEKKKILSKKAKNKKNVNEIWLIAGWGAC